MRRLLIQTKGTDRGEAMKILVMSDSHGKYEYVYSIVAENMDADVIIHLGDGPNDLVNTQLPTAEIFKVRGNCDFNFTLSTQLIEALGGYKFSITHGHEFGVKQGLEAYLSNAKLNNCDVALYGHTHIPFYEERDGVHIFNPGAVRNGSYGIINISEAGMEFMHCEM